MSNPIFVIALPHTYDYIELFKLGILQISTSAYCIDVFVTSKISNSAQLNKVLLLLYTQIRKLLLDLKFTYKFAINVHVNKFSLISTQNRDVFYVKSEHVPDWISSSNIIGIAATPLPFHAENIVSSSSVKFQSAGIVAVGGTFDHLHDGHKILLLMAAFAAETRVIVGVTGPQLLRTKKYSSVLESLEIRIKKICQFLQCVVQPGQRYDIYQINDVCGPTGFLPHLDTLVISEETIEGAQLVNSRRAEIGFSALNVVCVEVIGTDNAQDRNWASKLSSTEIRRLEYETINTLSANNE